MGNDKDDIAFKQFSQQSATGFVPPGHLAAAKSIMAGSREGQNININFGNNVYNPVNNNSLGMPGNPMMGMMNSIMQLKMIQSLTDNSNNAPLLLDSEDEEQLRLSSEDHNSIEAEYEYIEGDSSKPKKITSNRFFVTNDHGCVTGDEHSIARILISDNDRQPVILSMIDNVVTDYFKDPSETKFVIVIEEIRSSVMRDIFNNIKSMLNGSGKFIYSEEVLTKNGFIMPFKSSVRYGKSIFSIHSYKAELIPEGIITITKLKV